MSREPSWTPALGRPWQEGMDTALGLSFSWEEGADGLRRKAFGVWSVSDYVTKSVCCGRSGDSP